MLGSSAVMMPNLLPLAREGIQPGPSRRRRVLRSERATHALRTRQLGGADRAVALAARQRVRPVPPPHAHRKRTAKTRGVWIFFTSHLSRLTSHRLSPSLTIPHRPSPPLS